MRLLRPLTIACVAASLGVVAPAWGHGDPSGHYLETDLLYPSFSEGRPSQALELQLLGLLQATQRDGYPVKVAIVGGADDLEDPAMLRSPQRYAEQLVGELEVAQPVTAPLLVVSPHGVGVAGRAMRGKAYGPISRGSAPSLLGPVAGRRPAGGDGLAQTAMAAVRRVARVGGHALPAEVPPARTIAAGPPRAAPGDGSPPGWLPAVVFAAVFLLAWLAYELRTRAPRRRDRPVVT